MENPNGGLTVLASVMPLYALLAIAYVVLAWLIAKSMGARWLLSLWVIVSGLFAAGSFCTNVSYEHAYALSSPRGWVELGMLAIFPFAFGLATRSVHRVITREPDRSLNVNVLLRGVGAFFLGIGLLLVVFLLVDINRLRGISP